MQKWEYLVVYVQAPEPNPNGGTLQVDEHLKADKYTEHLNKYASGGWELMHFEWHGDQGGRAVFKRPRG